MPQIPHTPPIVKRDNRIIIWLANPPHPRIASAYAKETAASKRLLAASHKRSNSLPLASLPRGRRNSNPAPVKRQSPQDLNAGSYASIKTKCAPSPLPGTSGRSLQHDEPDTASITAVKSREMLRRKETIIFPDQTRGRKMSSVDEMVIASWGGGRQSCLDAVLSVPRRFREREAGDKPVGSASFTALRGSNNIVKNDATETESLELSTPPASRFPLPPTTPRHIANISSTRPPKSEVFRRRCSSLLSESLEASLTVHSGVSNGSILPESASQVAVKPLVIRKKAAIVHPSIEPSAVITQASNLTGKVNQTTSRPLAGAREGTAGTSNEEIWPVTSHRAVRCPPNIRGDPRNRI